MRIRVLQVPYDSGHRGIRMGAGPLRLVEGGLAERLEADGHRVRTMGVETELPLPTENTSTFQLARLLAAEVAAARARGELPLVLAGNCASCLGTVAGLGSGRWAVVWLDAHGDFNTPDTSASGFLDGMALSILVGDCWQKAAASIPGFEPVPAEAVLLAGARDLDPPEAERLADSRVARITAGDLEDEDAARSALEALASVADGVYVHVDLDVLDPTAARANEFAAPDGATVEGVEGFLRRVARTLPLGALAVTAYDPECDVDGRAAGAAVELIRGVLREPPA